MWTEFRSVDKCVIIRRPRPRSLPNAVLFCRTLDATGIASLQEGTEVLGIAETAVPGDTVEMVVARPTAKHRAWSHHSGPADCGRARGSRTAS